MSLNRLISTRWSNKVASPWKTVTALHTLSNRKCSNLQEELFRNRLVVGIQDKLLARLQLDAALALQKALKSIRQMKAYVSSKQSFVLTRRQLRKVLQAVGI